MKVLPGILVVFALVQGEKMQTPPKIHYQLLITNGRLDPLRRAEDPPSQGAGSPLRSALSFSAEVWVDLNDPTAPRIVMQEIRNMDDSSSGILEYCAIFSSDIDGDEFYGHFFDFRSRAADRI